jgi:Tol biopolymer transport system component
MKLGKLLISLVIVSLLVSMAIPMAAAKKPPKPPPQDPPADPAIAYFHKTSGPRPYELYVMNDDGSNKAVVFEGNVRLESNAAWSPDGGSIAWLHLDDSGFGIWRVDVTVVDGEPQGSNLQKIVGDNDCYLGRGVSWSPLGDEIAFVSQDRTSNTWWIKTVPADGNGPIEILYSGNEIKTHFYTTSWNSAGTHIAFPEKTIHTHDYFIKIIERATGIVTKTIFMGDCPMGRVEWARQGTDVLVFENANTGTISTIDINTEAVDLITTGRWPCWSPDNTHLAFTSTGKKASLVKYEISTGDITKLAGGVIRYDWRRF